MDAGHDASQYPEELVMVFAIFGLDWGQIRDLGLCCGVALLGVGVLAIVVLMIFSGKRSAKPDDKDEK